MRVRVVELYDGLQFFNIYYPHSAMYDFDGLDGQMEIFFYRVVSFPLRVDYFPPYNVLGGPERTSAEET